jgi:tetratricopeptide (TPR) repeat protein
MRSPKWAATSISLVATAMAEAARRGSIADQRGRVSRNGKIMQIAWDQYDRNHVSGESGPAPSATASLPPRPDLFVGREDKIAELLTLLDPREIPPQPILVSVLAGLPGIGKTALAVETAHRAAAERGWFPGGVLFLDMRGYDPGRQVTGEQAVAASIRALGVVDAGMPPTVDEQLALRRSMLSDLADRKRPVLVVADNVSHARQVKDLIPAHGEHRMLVTSRDTLAGLPARLIDVDELTPQAGAAMISRALTRSRPQDRRPQTEPDSLAELVRLCRNLPLALEIVAEVLIADPGLPFADLARELAREDSGLTGGRGDLAAVRAAFDLPYSRLPPPQARLFRLMSANPGLEVSTEAAAAVADEPIAETRDVLAALAQRHLVKEQPAGSNRWRMHDLVRLCGTELGEAAAETDGRETARDRLFTYYVESTCEARQSAGPVAYQLATGRFRDRNEAFAWLDAERPNLMNVVVIGSEIGRDRVAMELATHLFPFLLRRRYLDDAICAARSALAAARHIGERRSEVVALNNLGAALREARNLDEAIALHQRAARTAHRTRDRLGAGSSLDNLGTALLASRRFGEGIIAHRQAVASFRAVRARREEGAALNNLGNALYEARLLDAAIKAYQQAAAICQETGDRHEQGEALNNLGSSLGAARRLDEAVAVHQKAVAIFQETGDRLDEGVALDNLGIVLREARQFAQAVTVHEQALAISRETPDRHGEGTRLNNLGASLRAARRSAEAITLHQQAVAIFRETGDRHGEGGALDNLGIALREMNRFEEAITVHQEAVAVFQETGDRHGEGGALNNLSISLREMDRLDEAFTVHQEAVAVFQESGDRHGEGGALNNLSVALREMNRLDEAITVVQERVAVFQEIGDRRGEGVAQGNLGIALREARRFDEAITVHQEAVAIFQEIGDHRGEGRALKNLGRSFMKAHRFRRALQAFCKAGVIQLQTQLAHAHASSLESHAP